MKIQKNISLKPYNTFGLDVTAKNFCSITSIEDLKSLATLPDFKAPKLWLGGGSNMLLTKDFNGLVVQIALKGISIEKQSEDQTIVSVGAGENWHSFVLWTIEQKLGGIENLSLIPGNVGTAPIQNIGAYGVELKDVFLDLQAYNLDTNEVETLTKEECKFGYRDSIFKGEAKGKYVILNVRFILTSEKHYVLNTSYGAIENELLEMQWKPSLETVSKAVIQIRQRKLPDPKEIGNSGSFFKNPVVDKEKMESLKSRFPKLVSYALSENEYKLAAGWLIEQDGWKGYRDGDAGVHQNQALVLVNYGTAKGVDIQNLSKAIQASVFRTFEVNLEAEVNII